jgi:hypothetical protein
MVKTGIKRVETQKEDEIKATGRIIFFLTLPLIEAEKDIVAVVRKALKTPNIISSLLYIPFLSWRNIFQK